MIKTKIVLVVVLFVILINSMIVFSEPDVPSIEASSAIVIESTRGQALYRKEIDKKLHISVVCKVMTALVVLEKSKLDTQVTVSEAASLTKGAILNLKAGGKYDLERLLEAIIVGSANDAAYALAEYISGDSNKFVDLMNNKARYLDMKNTNFTNPTGLYDEAQYTTVEDLAILTRYALANPQFNRMFSLKAIPWFTGDKVDILVNQNNLFWSYEWVDGGKIGYNEKDKKTAITSATKGDRRLIAIVTDSAGDVVFDDTVKLFEYCFANFRSGVLVYSGQSLKEVIIEGKNVGLINIYDVYYTFPIGDNYIKSVEVNVDNTYTSNKLNIPIMKDQIIGKAKYTLKDNTIIDINLYPEVEVYPQKSYIYKILKDIFEYKEMYIVIIALLIIEFALIFSKIIKYIRRNGIKKYKR